MYTENSDHRQKKLINFKNKYTDKIQQKLEEGFAKIFYEEIFCNIDESKFAVLYSDEASRPNKPINILMGLEIIKQYFGFTDSQLIREFQFNIEIMSALGLQEIGEEYISVRTLYNFRDRVARYEMEEGINLIDEVFKDLVFKHLDKYDIDATTQRMDSTLCSSNMKKLTRLQLCTKTTQKFLRQLPEKRLSSLPDKIAQLSTEEGVSNYLDSIEDKSYDEQLTDIGIKIQELINIFEDEEEINSTEEYKLLVRVYREQFKPDSDEERPIPREGEEIASDSLQNPSDVDGTYRKKSGEEHIGYKNNISETCADGNEIDILVDAGVYPNNESDKSIIIQDIEDIQAATGANDLHVDGGFSGEEVEEKCQEVGDGVDLHMSGIKGAPSDIRELLSKYFEFDESNELTCCIEGCEPVKIIENEDSGYKIYKFPRSKCSNCSRDCPVEEQKKYFSILIYNRTVELIEREDNLEENTKKRAPVESVFYVLKHKFGLDKIPIRGLFKMSYWIKLKCIAFNFGRIMRYRLEKGNNKAQIA